MLVLAISCFWVSKEKDNNKLDSDKFNRLRAKRRLGLRDSMVGSFMAITSPARALQSVNLDFLGTCSLWRIISSFRFDYKRKAEHFA